VWEESPRLLTLFSPLLEKNLLELENIGAVSSFKLNLHNLKTLPNLPSVSSVRLQPTQFSCKFYQKHKNAQNFTAQKLFVDSAQILTTVS
jgi:hypothetical protein